MKNVIVVLKTKSECGKYFEYRVQIVPENVEITPSDFDVPRITRSRTKALFIASRICDKNGIDTIQLKESDHVFPKKKHKNIELKEVDKKEVADEGEKVE